MRALSRIPKLKRPVIRSKIQTAGKSMRPPFPTPGAEAIMAGRCILNPCSNDCK